MQKLFQFLKSGNRRGLLTLLLAFLMPSLAWADPVRVLTYNVWGLPSPLLQHGERFNEIPAALDRAAADVILIQEAFTGRAQALTHLPHFPFHTWGPSSRFLHFSSGLLILSRYPIVETAQTSYMRCGGFDCFANKGAQYAKILVPGIGPVSVFNTHLNANGHDQVRVSQAAHLTRFVQAYAQGLPTIVGGDFNGNGQALFDQNHDALKVSDAHLEFVNAHPSLTHQQWAGYTADPERNPFLSRGETFRRLDHIYLLEGAAPNATWKVDSDDLVFDGFRGKVLSDHFGILVTADLARKVQAPGTREVSNTASLLPPPDRVTLPGR
jgi:endonuclease/exonuclease/phosphatase family metal-dependent hydrolase